MKMGEKGKLELEKRKDTSTDYHSPNISSDWQFSGTNLANLPINLVPTGNPLAVVSSSSCSSAPLVDSFSQTIWDHSTNSQNLAYYDVDVQNNASSSSAFGFRKASSALLRSSIDRSLDLGWNPASSMLKGGIFLPNAPGLFRQSLSQSPADSAFIERAARFSSFSGGNFSDMMNTFGIPEPACLDSRVGGMTQGPQEVFAGSGGKSVSGGQSPKNGMHMAEVSKDASLLNQINVTTGGSTHKNEEKGESLAKSHEEAKKGFGRSGGDSDEAEFSGGGQDEPSAVEGTCGEPPVKVLSSKKRKRNGQDIELDQTKRGLLSGEAAKGNNDNQKKGDQNLSPSTSKPPGKQGKQGSQTSDPPKGDYIHVRARRGQATNSHSLAERVRREKISERMKFLQDIVPGCSKVTGKAVMLDEIINYVQSLQRQVEFLSMKLATVNPRLDFNIEGLLAKDILQSRPGPSPTLGFSPDMPMAYPPLHQSQGILVHAALPGMGNPSDIRLRTANSHLTAVSGVFKEASQATNVWEDELHNVVQMSYGASALSDSQDVNGSIPPGQMKVEL